MKLPTFHFTHVISRKNFPFLLRPPHIPPIIGKVRLHIELRLFYHTMIFALIQNHMS
jgi:hypothetical protein